MFPISNWTELDVWNYIRRENIALPSIYFAHEREVITRNGQLMAAAEALNMDADDIIMTQKCTFPYRWRYDLYCRGRIGRV